MSVKLMGLKHCVVTSVTRDDLPDGGAKHWHDTIIEIRRQNPDTKIEVLIPDFNGKHLLDIVDANPDIVAHNPKQYAGSRLQCVPERYEKV